MSTTKRTAKVHQRASNLSEPCVVLCCVVLCCVGFVVVCCVVLCCVVCYVCVSVICFPFLGTAESMRSALHPRASLSSDRPRRNSHIKSGNPCSRDHGTITPRIGRQDGSSRDEDRNACTLNNSCVSSFQPYQDSLRGSRTTNLRKKLRPPKAEEWA